MKSVILASALMVGSFALAEGSTTAAPAAQPAAAAVAAGKKISHAAARTECLKNNEGLKKDKKGLKACIKEAMTKG